MGRNAQRLEEIATHCRAAGAQVTLCHVDVKERDPMREALFTYDAAHPIDLLIANAGISAGAGGEDGTESEAQVREVFAVNIEGVLNSVLPVLPLMQKRRKGSVALMSSLAGLRGLPNCPSYSASKMAVRGLGEGLRGTYGPHGVKVSVICPGYIHTPMTNANNFPMPLLMDAEKAARIIQRGIAFSRARIAFPLALYLPLWLLTCLPVAWTDRFFCALPRKSPLNDTTNLSDGTNP